MKEITVQELQQKFINKEAFTLLDVREPAEYEEAAIQPSVLVPLAELTDRLTELDINTQYAVLCRVGGRSSRAVLMMEDHGFSNVANVSGGIRQWATEIDTKLYVT